MKKIGIVLTVAVLFGALVYGVKIQNDSGTGSPPGYSIPKKVQYSFVLRNTTNRRIAKAELWAYAPIPKTPTQRRVALTTSHPHELLSAGHGNQILYFQFPDLPPYTARTIAIKADLLLSDQPNPSNPFSQSDMTPYLEAEKFIESDDEALGRVARGLKTDDSLETAAKIHQWVADHVEYIGYTRRSRGALYALKHKKGDCTEFMYLFTALCRAVGVPARCVDGYVMEKSGVLRASEYHNWAEFYHNGSWMLADPQRRVFMEKSSEYIALRVIHEKSEDPTTTFNRFRFKGAGLKVKML